MTGDRPQLGNRYIVNLGGSQWIEDKNGDRRLQFLLCGGGFALCWVDADIIQNMIPAREENHE